MASATVPIRPCKILHIDDNVADSRLLREGLSGLSNLVFETATTFEAALTLLCSQDATERFNLIIMDWYLPPHTGAEMLSVFKADELLRPIPVIVFTGGADPVTVQQAYAAYASCVLVKPGDLDGFLVLAREIETFWLRMAQLPYCTGPGSYGGIAQRS